MTPDQIEAVKDSYFRIYPVRDQIAQSYYEELFRIAPSVRSHFPEDVKHQSRKLAETVGYIVSHLDNMLVLDGIISKMAERHLSYGLQPAHFAPSGVAFLNALSSNMPSEVTTQEVDAWMAAFTMVTELMTDEMTLKYRAA